MKKGILALVCLLIITCSIETKASTWDEAEYNGCTDFREGRAWAIKPKENIWKCIDTNGETVFVLEEGETPLTQFAHGVACTSTGNIYDSDGEIICSVEDGLYDTIYNNLDFFEGYFVVSKTTNTITDAVKEYGILDYNLQWALEPSEEYENLQSAPGLNESKFGLFWIDDYYDIETGETLEYEEMYNRLLARKIESARHEDLFFLEVNGSTGWNDETESFDLEKAGFKDAKTGFYDRDNKLVIDLSEYKKVECLNGFCNGLSSLKITNEVGGQFWAVIDKEGNFYKEPLQVNLIYGAGQNMVTIENTDREYDILNPDQEIVGTLHFVSEKKYNRGSCWFTPDGIAKVALYENGYIYITTEGKKL